MNIIFIIVFITINQPIQLQSVETTFVAVANNDRVRFFGNVEIVGTTTSSIDGAVAAPPLQSSQPSQSLLPPLPSPRTMISIHDLYNSGYSAVVFACGAGDDRRLGIPGMVYMYTHLLRYVLIFHVLISHIHIPIRTYI